jgi:hypothetical protein
MALLDVSELLTDPDFCSAITIIRVTEVIGDDGISVQTETQETNVVAVVEAGSGQQLVLLDDGSRISDSIRVYCTIPLAAATSTNKADKILFGGYNYICKNVRNWGMFGAGYWEADCEFIGLANP